jgi:PAS domain S-box-containing protein
VQHAVQFVSQTSDGVCAVDREQRIVLWNSSATRLLGFTADSVLGQRCYRVLGGTGDDGCRVCRRGCRMIGLARRGKLVPTRDLQVTALGGEQIWLNLSTILLPTSWNELPVLIHLFREAPPHASRGFAPRAEQLTRRQREVLRLLVEGASTREIARRMYVSVPTVRNHIHAILAKLHVHSRLEAVAAALRRGAD